MNLSPEEQHVLLHTLGMTVPGRASYRNHFVAGPGHHDLPALESLVEAGLMYRSRRPEFLPEDSMVFKVTDEGRKVAVEVQPKPPKLTRSQARYQRWLDISDISDITFGEFLKNPGVWA